MKKIIFIQPLIPNYSEAFFNSLAEELSDCELIVIANIETNNLLNQIKNTVKFRIYHQDSTRLMGLTFERGLFKLINKIDPDIIIYSASPRAVLMLPTLAFFRWRNVKIYGWGMFHRIGKVKFVTNLAFKMMGVISNKLLTYSRIGARNLLSLGVSSEKVSVMGTAIDEKYIQYVKSQLTNENIDEHILSYHLNGRKVILQVVRLSKIKKIELLIDAAETVVKKDKSALFVLIGDGEMRELLLKQVKELKLEENFLFLGAIYDEVELAKWFNVAMVFVMPTCIGLSAHHAFSYGVPIITDDSLIEQASESDILLNGVNSILYRTEDTVDFASKILEVITDSKMRNILCENALLTMKNQNRLEDKVANFKKVII